MLCRRSSFRKLLPRRLGAALTLFAYLFATVGFPVPRLGASPSGTPFPCQGHGCGCLTAEQCWQSCCCFTPEQRWAWARNNGFQPPPEAERPRGNGWNAPRLRDRTEGSPGKAKACCQTTPACCQTPKPQGDCCAPGSPEQPSPAKPSPEKPDEGSGLAWALGLSAQKCRGQSMLWVSLGAVVSTAASLAWSPSYPCIGWLSDRPLAAWALVHIPPSPPPRG